MGLEGLKESRTLETIFKGIKTSSCSMIIYQGIIHKVKLLENMKFPVDRFSESGLKSIIVIEN